MDVHRNNGTAVPVILTSAIVYAMLMVLSCSKPFPGFTKQQKETATVKKYLPVKKFEKKKKKRKLFITFDDGPNKGTKNVLHIVQDEQVPASFFIVGEHAFASTAQQQMWDSLQAAKNIELCNHSYSHAHSHYQKYYQYPDSVVHDFERTKDSLQLTNNIARTPGRNIWRTDSLRYTDLKKSVAAAHPAQYVIHF